MTWIDIVDTAVKIGLGALIGGVFSLVSINLSHRSQLIQKRDERLAKALEDVSRQVENNCSQALSGFVIFGKEKFVPILSSGNKEKALQASLEMHESQFERDLKFQELVGILRLYGCSAAADTLQEISHVFQTLSDQFSSALETEGPKRVIVDSKTIEPLKLRFYQELNKKLNDLG
jgi:hypothetical protein